MNVLVPPTDSVDWSPSSGAGCRDSAADLGTSPPLHDRLQHLTLRKKTSYR